MIVTFSTTIERRSDPHSHSVHEFIVGSRGEAILASDGISYSINDRHTILVPAGIKHHYEISSADAAAAVTFICFDDKYVRSYFPPGLLPQCEALLQCGVSTSNADSSSSNEIVSITRLLKQALREK